MRLRASENGTQLVELIKESKFGMWASEFLVCTFPWKVAVAEKS
jgi:hypothetical protein